MSRCARPSGFHFGRREEAVGVLVELPEESRHGQFLGAQTAVAVAVEPLEAGVEVGFGRLRDQGRQTDQQCKGSLHRHGTFIGRNGLANDPSLPRGQLGGKSTHLRRILDNRVSNL